MPTLLSHPWAIGFRNLLRQSEIARSVYRYWMAHRDYEENFSRHLLRAVGPSTVVWDVGANVGLYTTQFLERGALQVVCFEPAPAAVAVLEEKFGRHTSAGARVRIMPVALSDRSGTASFIADDTAVTNRLAANGERGAVEVRVERADRLIAERAVPQPHVIKVDVEGFELEVLTGCGALLQSPSLAAVFVEVHFRLLHERGLDHAAQTITSLLRDAGFDIEWLDLSHVAGIRRHATAGKADAT